MKTDSRKHNVAVLVPHVQHVLLNIQLVFQQISCQLGKTCMFFKATFLKIFLFDLKRYCIWLEDALYVAGTVCATCFFLPEVLYLVRYEMGLWIKNAYLHVGKNTDWSKWRDIFSIEKWLSAKECYLLKRKVILLKECYTLWMKVSVCKACSCHLELILQEKDACLIVSCSHLQRFHCLL